MKICQMKERMKEIHLKMIRGDINELKKYHYGKKQTLQIEEAAEIFQYRAKQNIGTAKDA